MEKSMIKAVMDRQARPACCTDWVRQVEKGSGSGARLVCRMACGDSRAVMARPVSSAAAMWMP